MLGNAILTPATNRDFAVGVSVLLISIISKGNPYELITITIKKSVRR